MVILNPSDLILGSVYLRVIFNLFYTILGSVYLRVSFNLYYTLLEGVYLCVTFYHFSTLWGSVDLKAIFNIFSTHFGSVYLLFTFNLFYTLLDSALLTIWNDTIEIIDFYNKIQLTPYQINTVRLTPFGSIQVIVLLFDLLSKYFLALQYFSASETNTAWI